MGGSGVWVPSQLMGWVRWYSWYVLAPVDRGGATSTPRNSYSFGRKIIIKTGICSLRPGEYKNTCFPEILDCCGGITRKSCDPCKKQGPKHTSCTIVVSLLRLSATPHYPYFFKKRCRERKRFQERGSRSFSCNLRSLAKVFL